MTRACMLLAVGLCGWSAGSNAAATDEAGWLGCQIAPVPKSLEAQLDLKGGGAMVVNVFKDSPADKASLERYDVIVKVGDGDVGSAEALRTEIRKHKPGEKVALHVINKGKTKTVELTLAAAPTGEMPPYKYDPLPDALFDDRFRVGGKIFRRGPDGWIMDDLGELDDIPGFLDHVLPRLRSKQGRYWLKDEQEGVDKFQARVSRDDQVIEVEGKRDGPITVRRTLRKDEGEKRTERTYQNPQELQQNDPEAYRIYCEATARPAAPGKPIWRRRGVFENDALQRYRKELQDMMKKVPDRERIGKLLDENRRKWGREVEEELDAIRKRFDAFEKQLEQRLGPAPHKDAKTTEVAPPPATRFEVAPDGRITAHVRQGDSELSLTFENTKQLEAKRPDLYKKYQSLDKKP